MEAGAARSMKVEAEHPSYGFWGICIARWVTGSCSVPTVKQQHAIEGGSQVSVISFRCKRMLRFLGLLLAAARVPLVKVCGMSTNW